MTKTASAELSFCLDLLEEMELADVRALEDACTKRRGELLGEHSGEFAVGDKVETHGISPQYLSRVRGTVVEADTGTKAKPRTLIRIDDIARLDPRAAKYLRPGGLMDVLTRTIRPV